MTERSTEVLVGAAVLAVAALFLFYASQVAGLGGSTNERVPYTASFRSVEGIAVGSDVRMGGVKVGTVTDVQMNPETYRAEVVIGVDEEIKLPTDTAIVIASEGLLGGNFVELEPGGALETIEPGGEIFDSVSAISLLALLVQIFADSGGGDGAAQ